MTPDTTHSPAPASFPLVSTANVPTQRAARYGKQLVTHMAHKVTGEWNEETASGYLLFDREGPAVGRFDVSAMPSTLILELRTTPERADHLVAAHRRQRRHHAGSAHPRRGRGPRPRQESSLRGDARGRASGVVAALTAD